MHVRMDVCLRHGLLSKHGWPRAHGPLPQLPPSCHYRYVSRSSTGCVPVMAEPRPTDNQAHSADFCPLPLHRLAWDIQVDQKTGFTLTVKHAAHSAKSTRMKPDKQTSFDTKECNLKKKLAKLSWCSRILYSQRLQNTFNFARGILITSLIGPQDPPQFFLSVYRESPWLPCSNYAHADWFLLLHSDLHIGMQIYRVIRKRVWGCPTYISLQEKMEIWKH